MSSRNVSSASPVHPSGSRDVLAHSPFRQHWLAPALALLTLCVSLLVTAALWHNAKEAAYEDLQSAFELRVRETLEDITERMEVYEQVLRGTKGFLLSSMAVSREEFRFYIASLRLEEHYPGILGVGMVDLLRPQELEAHSRKMRREGLSAYETWPTGVRDSYAVITQIEPLNDANRRAIGFDMFSEPERSEALRRSRDTARGALSGKVHLKQETRDDAPAGFLMFYPVYDQDMSMASVEERREGIIGWVYAAFRIHEFLNGLGGERSTDLHLSIYDSDQTSQESCMFNCAPVRGQNSVFDVSRQVLAVDQPWTLRLRSTPSFEARLDHGESNLIAAGGLVISLLLSLFVGMLAGSRHRALAAARYMTRELRQSHRHIAADKERIERIIENSHDAFVALDPEGRVTDWNAQAERTFGWPARQALGKKLENLIIPDEFQAAHRAGFNAFARSGQGEMINQRMEVMARHQDGSPIPIELAVAALKTGAGYGAHAFIRDLRTEKEAARREAQRQQALEETRTALQHAQRMEAVGQLTGGVAHDFNNVLQIIAGNIQLLQIESGNPEQRAERLESALNAVERGAKLSSQLLAFARRQPLQPMVINLRQLMGSMDELLRHALGELIEIETVIGGGLWNTLVDPHQLENVILNLAINARDAMQGQGKLTIELGNALLDDEYVLTQPDVPAGQYVVLAVSDTGPGMTAKIRERVFDPFFSTKPEGEGTGLGLSMAYGFVKQSGGHIRIYSELGHGTTVRIYLPRSMAQEMPIPPCIAHEDAAGGTETILVVEDDQSVQMTVAAMLRKLGYRVLQANDGASALELLRSGEQVDLLFTDVVMPGPVRSTELAREAQVLLPGLAVLFTSGYTQNAIVHGGRLDPGVHLLSKPYRREQLARKIRQLLDQPAEQDGTAVPPVPAPATPSSAHCKKILVVEESADLCTMACELLLLLGHQAHGVQTAEDALAHAREQTVDVLFTELELRNLGGLELAQRLREIQPQLQVIYAFSQGQALPATGGEQVLLLKKPYNLEQLRRVLART